MRKRKCLTSASLAFPNLAFIEPYTNTKATPLASFIIKPIVSLGALAMNRFLQL